jgi:glucokinase
MPLILISGPIAAGKSSVAGPVARALGLPLIAKDTVKEALFDALGVGDRSWSDRLSTASYAVVFALTKEQAAGAVLDANFKEERHAEDLLRIDRRPIEVFMTAPPEEIVRRFRDRAPERHPGHLDGERTVGEIREEAERGPLELGGPLLVVDTSKDVDPDDLVRWLRSVVAG